MKLPSASACALSALLLGIGLPSEAALVHHLVVNNLTNGAGYLNNATGTVEFDVRSILSGYVNPVITAVSYSARITDDGNDISESLSHTPYEYRYTDTSQCVRPTPLSSCSNNHILVYTRAGYHHYYDFWETLHLTSEGGESAGASTQYFYMPPPAAGYLGTVFDGMVANINIYNDDIYYYTDHYLGSESGYRGDATVNGQMRDADVLGTFADGFVRFQVQVANDAIFTGATLTFTIAEAPVVNPGNGVAVPGTLWLAGLAGALAMPGFGRRRRRAPVPLR